MKNYLVNNKIWYIIKNSMIMDIICQKMKNMKKKITKIKEKELKSQKR